MEAESGSTRVRRLTLSGPRLEQLTWDLSQTQFRVFDLWWQETIGAGAREFDILLSDLAYGTVWFTARWIGAYQAEISGVRYRWRVTGTVRLLGDPFTERPSGTDELRGRCAVDLQAKGRLEVPVSFTGAASVGIEARGRLSGAGGFLAATLGITGTGRIPLGPLRGLGSLDVAGTAANTEFGVGQPQIERVWSGMQWWAYGRSADILANEEAVHRSAMGITNVVY
jgi:hypothetical protein